MKMDDGLMEMVGKLQRIIPTYDNGDLYLSFLTKSSCRPTSIVWEGQYGVVILQDSLPLDGNLSLGSVHVPSTIIVLLLLISLLV